VQKTPLSPGMTPVTPYLDKTRCVGCGLCVLACPCQAIEIVDGLPVFRCQTVCERSTTCIAVVHGFEPCESACPVGAISCAIEIRRDD